MEKPIQFAGKDMPTEISFGKWLRQRRRTLDLTQKALANQVGCAEITVRQIEADALKPSKELAEILLQKLGISEFERPRWIVFARGRSGFPQKTEPRSSRLEQKTNLPTPLTSFIGRQNEVERVKQRLMNHRLVTLTGTGGIGKTRLALEVGQAIPNDYPDGVWFIPLDSLSDSALVPQTIAAVFDIRDVSSETSLIERLIYSLHKKTILLILDNCEHLLDACAQLITTLLANCPNLKVLVTSREILNMEGEAIHNASTLSIPEIEETSIKKVSDHESIQLFTERAALVLTSFHLTTENVQTTANICRKLDGIPLAIEMAAARVDILSANEILAQLNRCFDLLVGKSRTAQSRHQTIRASMDWSWGLLSQSEQIFMSQLSVFAGGWTLESAQAVYEDNPLHLIGALVKKSLIVVNQETGRETRYRFHEIVRQYAREKLVASDKEDDARTRHLQYFLQLSERAEPALKGPWQVEWMSRLNDEHNNIRASLEWAHKTNVEAGLYLASRLDVFWELFDIREGEHWLGEFIQNPESKAYAHARAKALRAFGWFKNWLERFVEARSVAQESLDLYRACGDKYGQVDALLLLAVVVNPSDAGEFHRQALTLAQSLNDKWRTANALQQWGWDQPARHSYVKKALKLFQEVGDIRYMAECMTSLGRLAMLNNQIESAQKMLDRATILYRQLNIRSGMSGILQYYGQIAAIKGDYEQAYTYLKEDAAISEQYGYRINHLFTRTHLGYLALNQGKIMDAREIFVETIRIFFNNKNEIGMVFNLEGLAGLFVAIGKLELAAQLIGCSDATRERFGNPRPLLQQADMDKVVAACLAKMGEVAFSDAYDEGQKMTLDEAVAYALEEN